MAPAGNAVTARTLPPRIVQMATSKSAGIGHANRPVSFFAIHHLVRQIQRGILHDGFKLPRRHLMCRQVFRVPGIPVELRSVCHD